jgi:hypothetical protein
MSENKEMSVAEKTRLKHYRELIEYLSVNQRGLAVQVERAIRDWHYPGRSD